MSEGRREPGSEGYWKAKKGRNENECNKMKFTGETVDSLFTKFITERREGSGSSRKF